MFSSTKGMQLAISSMLEKHFFIHVLCCFDMVYYVRIIITTGLSFPS